LEVFGVPGHPLFVHVPVIVVPLSAALLVATGWKAEWRRWFTVPLILLVVGAAVFSVLAVNSGEELEDMVEDNVTEAEEERIEEHEDAGETARNAALLFMIVTAGYAGVAYAADQRRSLPGWAPLGAYGVASVVALIAVLSVVDAGHSGAEAAWKDRASGESQSARR